jgi:hypothetical protein
MNEYFIELHQTNALYMCIADLADYGAITRHLERYPTQIWISSPWDKDIIEAIPGVKTVREKKHDHIPLSPTYGRTWVDLMGTKWDETQ